MSATGIMAVCGGLAALPLALHIMNWPVYRRTTHTARNSAGLVSVLIPARNEEANIGDAVRAALASEGVAVEVLVLDDQSEDRTRSIVEAISNSDHRVRLLAGRDLPSGWCGKQHASWLLAQAAKGERLLFVDADVRISPRCADRMSGHLAVSGMALVSGVPRQKTITLLERLLVPLIHYLLLGFLPMFRMRQTSKPGYAAGCGQLFMADAAAYTAAGGHSAIRASLHDGISLPRAFRRAGFRTDLVDATDLAVCRMFENAGQVWRGLSRNAVEGLASPKLIVPATLVLLGGQVMPWVLVGFTPWMQPWQALTVCAAAALTLAPRVVNALRFRQSWLGAVLHPLGILLLVALQWHALLRYLLSKPSLWRGRSYSADGAAPMLAANHPETP